MATNETALTHQGATEIARGLEGEKVTNVQRLGKLLAASGYFTDARDMAQAAVKVLAGDELGIPPVASMMGINIIKGKVALGANLIASRIRAHGYDYRFNKFDAAGCVREFLSKVENGQRRVMGESSFTDADAKQAEIKSEMYKKYPRNMFFARAISNGARWYTPEVFAGAPIYTPEELGAAVDENGDMEHADAPITVQPIPSEQPKVLDFGAQVREFQKQKQRVGEPAYYRVLGSNGYQHSNEVVKLPNEQKRSIYRELAALPDYAPEQGDAFEPTEEV